MPCVHKNLVLFKDDTRKSKSAEGYVLSSTEWHFQLAAIIQIECSDCPLISKINGIHKNIKNMKI